jgi:hypothetical protein
MEQTIPGFDGTAVWLEPGRHRLCKPAVSAMAETGDGLQLAMDGFVNVDGHLTPGLTPMGRAE